MRTYIFSALAALTFGLLTLTPANAEKAAWTCMSPAFACGGAPTAKSYRSQEFAGERTYRRQASGKRNRVAKHQDSSRRVARTERKEQQPEKAQAKVELPERKQTPPQAKAAAEQPKDKTAERKVEFEKSYRTTSSQSGMASYYGSEFGLADGFRRTLQPECHDGRASQPAVRYQGARHQQAQRPLRRCHHQRPRSVHSRSHHRPVNGGGRRHRHEIVGRRSGDGRTYRRLVSSRQEQQRRRVPWHPPPFSCSMALHLADDEALQGGEIGDEAGNAQLSHADEQHTADHQGQRRPGRRTRQRTGRPDGGGR